MINASPLQRVAALSLVTALALPGCATTGEDYQDPNDPLEGINRAVYRFNDSLDKVLIKPLAEGYNAFMPAPLNRGVTNFFSNLDDVSSAVNNLLQLKLGRAATDVGRVAVNTTVGVVGFIDVASNLDLPKYGEDFGQTLGTWGFSPGPFIVLPVLGPSTVRDGVGLVADWYLDPVTYIEDDTVRWSVRGLDLVDTRADMLGASRVLEQAALDPYAFMRDAYLQHRRSLVYDGNPPPEPEPNY
jgi:phospholipid-binding lipoprotein MlaA